MLLLSGEVLDVATKTGGSQDQPFDYLEVCLRTGKTDIDRARLARDFVGQIPKEGDQATLGVVVSAYSSRNGAGYRLTAIENRSHTPAAKAS